MIHFLQPLGSSHCHNTKWKALIYTTKAKALIDQGSEISLISENLVQGMKLTRTRSSILLVGIGA